MQKEILAIVNNFAEWQGNSFTLAKLVEELVKEKAATIAEEKGAQEVADAIRGL